MHLPWQTRLRFLSSCQPEDSGNGSGKKSTTGFHSMICDLNLFLFSLSLSLSLFKHTSSS